MKTTQPRVYALEYGAGYGDASGTEQLVGDLSKIDGLTDYDLEKALELAVGDVHDASGVTDELYIRRVI